MSSEGAAWLVTALTNLGRNDEARRIGEPAQALAGRVLEQRPGYRLALHAQEVIDGTLATVAQNELNPTEALRIALRDKDDSTTLFNLDPTNLVSANNLASLMSSIGDALWSAGKLRESMPYYLQMIEYFRRTIDGGAAQTILYTFQLQYYAVQQAQLGDIAAAAATMASLPPLLAKLRQGESPDSISPIMVDALGKAGVAYTALEADELPSARDTATEAMKQLSATKPEKGFQETQAALTMSLAANIAGHAQYRLGNYPARRTGGAHRGRETKEICFRFRDGPARRRREIHMAGDGGGAVRAAAKKPLKSLPRWSPCSGNWRPSIAGIGGNPWNSPRRCMSRRSPTRKNLPGYCARPRLCSMRFPPVCMTSTMYGSGAGASTRSEGSG